MVSKRTVLLVVVVGAVILAGCSGNQVGLGDGDGGDAGEPNPNVARDDADGGGGANGDAAESGGDGDGSGSSEPAQQAFRAQNRAIIRTATVEVQVDTFATAQDQLVSVARDRGGWVASSSETTHREGNRTWKSGRLVFRIPSEEFSAGFADVKGVGEVDHAESDTQDVTDRLVDMEARLGNLRSQRERLRGLYEDANDTEAVLRIEERLSEVQGEIERLEAQQRNLEGRVAYSTITVEYYEQPPEPTETTPTPEASFHEVGLISAFASSVQGVVVAVQTIAVTVAYVLPYALVFGLPLVGLAYISRQLL